MVDIVLSECTASTSTSNLSPWTSLSMFTELVISPFSDILKKIKFLLGVLNSIENSIDEFHCEFPDYKHIKGVQKSSFIHF